jgi:hypothetical protein
MRLSRDRKAVGEFVLGQAGYLMPMTHFGYTLMTEQSGPKDRVRYAVSAEKTGFDFCLCGDHRSPRPFDHRPKSGLNWSV